MKKVILSVSLILSILSSNAKHVSLKDASLVGLNYFKHITSQPQATIRTDKFYTEDIDVANSAYYVFDILPTGFIIVSADDCAEPILGYSTEVNYTEPTDAEFTVKEWLANYAAQIREIIEVKAQPTDLISQKWKSYLNNNISKAKAGKSVPILCKTSWNQTAPYNNLCPVVTGQTAHAVTGCVATAMAQIMKYWNYPPTGNSSYSYTPSGYNTQSVNFGNTTYDWYKMTGSGAASNTAIATINYHCGVSVDMNYGVSSSGAWVLNNGGPCSEVSYATYFKYKPTISGIERANYSDAQWLQIIEDELMLRQPIQYVGWDNSPGGGGHTWVCDGFDTNDNLHMNWGWGGMNNGYFNMNALNPSALGTGGGSGTAGFNSGQQILYGIQPKNDMYEVGNTNQGKYTIQPTFVNDETSFTTSNASFNAYNDTDYYRYNLPAGYNYLVKSTVNDKYYNQAAGGYTVDVDAFYKVGNNYWNGSFDNYIDSFMIGGGQTLDFMVYPYIQYSLGSYQLNVNITRIAATGVNNIDVANKISISPNPAQNSISVNGINLTNCKIQITNTLGQLFTDNIVIDNSKSIDISELANGIYLLNITNQEQTITKKFVVNK
jgi:hypothetical protein